MKRAFWLALDLVREGPSAWRTLAVLIYPAVLLPLQSGLIDGAIAGDAPQSGVIRLRASMMLASLPCGILALGVMLEGFLPRRIRGDLEAILATPLTEREIVMACALPGWVAAVIYAPCLHVLALAGYVVSAGRLPAHAAAEGVWLWLGTLVSMVWISAAVARAAFRARSLGGALAWGAAGFIPAAVTDALCAATALRGAPEGAWPVLGASLGGALLALRLAVRSARSEDLLTPL